MKNKDNDPIAYVPHLHGHFARCDYCHRAVSDADICLCEFYWHWDEEFNTMVGIREHNYRQDNKVNKRG